MMESNNNSDLIQFTASPRWYTVRGGAMIAIGGLVATLCLVSPNVYILGLDASWVPVIGVVVLLVGILHCVDGLTAQTTQGYLFNIQGGILDVVVGFLTIFSSKSDVSDVNSINLLIVGYLLTQGIYRNVLLSAAEIRNPLSNRITGVVSIILGIMVWADWPTSVWFIGFSLSIDICFRGWTLIVMSSSIDTEAQDS